MKTNVELLAKAAWDEYRQKLLPTCSKSDYAGLMIKWENIGLHNQEVWIAVVIRICELFLIAMKEGAGHKS